MEQGVNQNAYMSDKNSIEWDSNEGYNGSNENIYSNNENLNFHDVNMGADNTGTHKPPPPKGAVTTTSSSQSAIDNPITPNQSPSQPVSAPPTIIGQPQQLPGFI